MAKENRTDRTNEGETAGQITPGLIPPHGGYQQLKSYQMSVIVYDGTVKFRDRFIDRASRTHDQMVQAARSGNKNIAEGSQASGTSKKIELKLAGIARASLEELLGDYGDFLRQRGFAEWGKNHPIPGSSVASPTRKIGPIRRMLRSSRTRRPKSRQTRSFASSTKRTTC